MAEPEVSVVMPCLNEERTLATCIRGAFRALRQAGLDGEVVVADNGSCDGSCGIAVEEGARLVSVPARGYGNALYHGFLGARGRYLVCLDSDLSYETAHIPRFVEGLRQGADLVMGSRLRGTIDHRAMPWLHRYLGTPALTFLARLFFGTPISDINCGMRGLTKDAFQRLSLQAGGMEFASEMVIKASLLEMTIAEVPTDLHPDARERRPHLRPFRDGWRHLRFMLLFCPRWLFLFPGLALLLAGMTVITAILLGASPYFGLFTCLLALSGTVLGNQMVLLGIAAHNASHLRRWHVARDWVHRLLSHATLERGLAAGGGLAVAGGGILAYTAARIFMFMQAPGYAPEQLDVPSTRLALLGATLLVSGIQVGFASFLVSLFGIEGIEGGAETRAPASVSSRTFTEGRSVA